jgi:hypothetical protein
MDDGRALPQDQGPHLGRARRALTVADEVGVALRLHRRHLGLSPRAYALRRGLSATRLAQLETGAGEVSLSAVARALDGTGFTLVVATCPDDPDLTPDDGAAASAVPAPEGAREGIDGPTDQPTWFARARRSRHGIDGQDVA